MKLRKIHLIFVFILGLTFVSELALAQSRPAKLPKLTVFYSPSCHRCNQIKETVMPGIEKEFKNFLVVEYRDISNIENYRILLNLKQRFNPKMALRIPVFFLKGRLVNYEDLSKKSRYVKQDIFRNLRRFIDVSLKKTHRETELSGIDLLIHFKNFTPLAIVSAGLIDGVNPCAFTVIVFFISFLTLQGYRKKELIVIGTGFIFSVFLTYLLLGLGLFNFLYKLKGFWVVTRAFNISIGVFSIILGILALHDFVQYRKTSKTEGLLLQLPAAVKRRIQYVIGLHYRKTASPSSSQAEGQKRILRLTLTAFVTGFLVSILEAVCTGQTYLPTISFILKTTTFKLQALFYLLVYNFMFIVPLGIIFVLALLGVASQQFAAFLKKHLLTIKVLMALLFFGFGLFLIWRA
ncbi:MAG: hypothetical protein AMJ95_08150 [Omnitrophica WOR_2 bacterium SM23_72]|nr:MAG: hypothetical protein AMJ95_08150 [Omnitrophica WOR_2 bacterium SM23_72]